MKLQLKNILFFVFFLSLLTQGTAKCYTSATQNDFGSVVFQKTSSLPDIENAIGTNGILQSPKLTERNLTGSNTIKINKKQGSYYYTQKFFTHSADYFRSYYFRHINSLSPPPLYLIVRSLII